VVEAWQAVAVAIVIVAAGEAVLLATSTGLTCPPLVAVQKFGRVDNADPGGETDFGIWKVQAVATGAYETTNLRFQFLNLRTWTLVGSPGVLGAPEYSDANLSFRDAQPEGVLNPGDYLERSDDRQWGLVLADHLGSYIGGTRVPQDVNIRLCKNGVDVPCLPVRVSAGRVLDAAPWRTWYSFQSRVDAELLLTEVSYRFSGIGSEAVLQPTGTLAEITHGDRSLRFWDHESDGLLTPGDAIQSNQPPLQLELRDARGRLVASNVPGPDCS
jgi:hypothetical protein